MYSIQGEVISDQFYPLKFNWFWVSLRRYGKKNDLETPFGKKSQKIPFFLNESPPNDEERLKIKWTLMDRIDQILLPPVWKTCFSILGWIWHAKNDLVIVQKFWEMGWPRPPILGKIPKKYRFFWKTPLSILLHLKVIKHVHGNEYDFNSTHCHFFLRWSPLMSFGGTGRQWLGILGEQLKLGSQTI